MCKPDHYRGLGLSLDPQADPHLGKEIIPARCGHGLRLNETRKLVQDRHRGRHRDQVVETKREAQDHHQDPGQDPGRHQGPGQHQDRDLLVGLVPVSEKRPDYR